MNMVMVKKKIKSVSYYTGEQDSEAENENGWEPGVRSHLKIQKIMLEFLQDSFTHSKWSLKANSLQRYIYIIPAENKEGC